MDSGSNPFDEIEIELETKPIKEIIKDIDYSKVNIKDTKVVTEFISGMLTNSYKFPLIVSSKDTKRILINEDKIKVLAMFFGNRIKLDSRYTMLHYEESYACDFPDEIIDRLLEKEISIIYIDERYFSKEVMDNIAKEVNFYPYPACIKSII